MNKKLVIIAHPSLSKSRGSTSIINEMKKHDIFELHEIQKIYEESNWNIDISKEHKKWEEASEIIILSPVWWYNVTSLMKKYLEDIIKQGFAFKMENGKILPASLKDKPIRLVLTTMGSEDDYKPTGIDLFTLEDVFTWAKSLASFTSMKFKGVDAIYGVPFKSDEIVSQEAQKIVSKLAKD